MKEVPGFCPECIGISMRDDSGNEDTIRVRKKSGSKDKSKSTIKITTRQRINYDEVISTHMRADEMDNERTSMSLRSEESKRSTGYGGYSSNRKVQRPLNLCGGYAYNGYATAVAGVTPERNSPIEENPPQRKRGFWRLFTWFGSLFKRT
ncbi:hypothetical protein H072_1219 [Dactylellina haptotyla CBS 200.50]|uniref:Uncharacterized protein n=1 Tax=Dactylellina haptotyla (strain CBS 200.50) TaxID=1284197 RepID=S8BZ91_DACHA|nr:hypothetical protein H072_1219 [Dactylellina haptotyla CBS 200.50]